MGQSDILEVLEKAKEPLSRGQIAQILNFDLVKVSHSISRLIKARDIKVIEINREQAMKKYKCKHRMLLYYV